MIHPIFLDWNLHNKRVFLRADLNVPLMQGKIGNDFRLTSILPTINALLDKGAEIVLATHIGRPDNQYPELSTQHLIPWFKKHGYHITFVPDYTAIKQYPIQPHHILLLENVRFFPGEKDADPFFAKQLANGAHYYVNDAFGLIHEHDCSVSVLPYEFPENRRSIGLLIEKELTKLDILKHNPQHPFIAILGGGKIEDKIPLIQQLLPKVDTLLICPALCFSFLKAMGKPVGKSLVNDAMIPVCKQIILQAERLGVNYIFPSDYQIAYDSINGSLDIVNAEEFPENAVGISIGPKTIEQFITEINKSRTIFFNCAMGFADKPTTIKNTQKLIHAMAQSDATTIIAGGDSVDIAFETPGHQSITHLSTGGGAALAYLSGALLPGLLPFEEE
jgi:phosphoglycerate kinase